MWTQPEFVSPTLTAGESTPLTNVHPGINLDTYNLEVWDSSIPTQHFLHQCRLVERPDLITVQRPYLVGQHIWESAPKTEEAIRQFVVPPCSLTMRTSCTPWILLETLVLKPPKFNGQHGRGQQKIVATWRISLLAMRRT